MAIASATDVQALLGRELTTEETTMINRLLEMAEREILDRIPDLFTRIADGKLSEDTVKDIETKVVLRVAKNPDGYVLETDGNYTYQLNPQAATGEITFTKAEWNRLGYRRGVFTIKPVVNLPWES